MAQENSTSSEISKYVSNTDKDIYTVSNIPEEVIAVIFAYVSRSPKSFRENIGVVIQEEQHGVERAAKFHEKWVLNYGHSSVAEHAAVHLGVEKVSRLFSSILELSNEYLSFTEYSQRYQKPEKGDFFTPEELIDSPNLLREYVDLNNHVYDIYAELYNRLFEYLKDTEPTPEGTDEKTHHRALEKLAFEDARYALTLATFTNLGMTGNARAMEDSLSELLSSRYSEVRKRAQEIKDEVKFSVPTLVKYADENKYITQTRNELKAAAESLIRDNTANEAINGGSVNLLEWTGQGSSDAEKIAVGEIVKALVFEQSDSNYKEIDTLINNADVNTTISILQNSLERLKKYDNPIRALKLVKYKVEYVISEACWHQLLRHRKTDWIFQEPSIKHSITIPPNIENAGMSSVLKQATEKCEELHLQLVKENLHEVASYMVTNAHNRRVIGSFDLWELFHLINLRMSEGAQWDIKNITGILANKIAEHHPALIAPALKRIK